MYATVEDLASLFGEEETTLLSNRGLSENMDREALETAIAYASSEVDSYLAARYAVPLPAPVTPVVMMVTADIFRNRQTSGDVSEKEPIVTRYKSTVAWLKDVASGIVSLPCAGAVSEGTSEDVEIDAGARDWVCRV